MNRDKVLLSFLLLLIPFLSNGQKIVTASGEYVYFAPSNITLDQAKTIALERAKIQIIADNFGTVMGVNNSTVVSNVNGKSSVSFLSVGESEVKGEWLETIGTPVYKVIYDDNFSSASISVSVKGKIRERVVAPTQFDAKILKNGTEDRFESDSFREDDELYISFVSPVNGYLSIYLYDKNGVSRLLPLRESKESNYIIEAGQKYTFFEQKVLQYSSSLGSVTELTKSIYTLTCSENNEINRMYLVFSPNKFNKAIDTIPDEIDIPASLSFESFQHWLSKSRNFDSEMNVMIRDIVISK